MNIAYLTTSDPLDISGWSGLNTYILRTLQGSGFRVAPIGNLKKKINPQNVLKAFWYRKIASSSYILEQDPAVLKYYASQIESRLSSIQYDLIFSPSTIPIAYLDTKKPIVFWTDATFAGMINYYPYPFSGLCAESIKNGNDMEQRALSKCRIAIYSSDWAADTAIKCYDVDPIKVKVVPFGANVECNRSIDDIEDMLRKKNLDICKLLFVGVDWGRKGGVFALEVAELLNCRGIPTELHVIGCDPKIKIPKFVKKHGFISKRTKSGEICFDQLMAESHFLILPARAECCAVVLAEANSFGLPTLASRTGGIPTVIRNGKNGQTFDMSEGPEAYCKYIESVFSSKQFYRELALASFHEYSERLNWSSAGRKVHDLIKEHCRG